MNGTARTAMTIMSHLWCLRITVIIAAKNFRVGEGQNLRRLAREPTAFSGAFVGHRGAYSQTQRVQANEPGRVALVVSLGAAALHGRDLRIVKALRTFPAGGDDVALVKLQPHDAGDVALRFSDQRL